MKKIICLVFALLVLATFIAVGNVSGEQEKYFRIHIRANSNEQCDQDVKLLIRERVTQYLTPHLSVALTKEQAQEVIAEHLPQIEEVCNEVLVECGYGYTACAKVCKEQFPVRKYGSLVLPDGVYDALIVELGEAKGDNWWCVIYPPLCFVGHYDGTNKVYYKSKLQEIINNFIDNNQNKYNNQSK